MGQSWLNKGPSLWADWPLAVFTYFTHWEVFWVADSLWIYTRWAPIWVVMGSSGFNGLQTHKPCAQTFLKCYKGYLANNPKSLVFIVQTRTIVGQIIQILEFDFYCLTTRVHCSNLSNVAVRIRIDPSDCTRASRFPSTYVDLYSRQLETDWTFECDRWLTSAIIRFNDAINY